MVSNVSDDGSAALRARPLIGLTTYAERAQMQVWHTEFAMLQRTYVRAVAESGGVPVLLPPVEVGVAEVLDAVNGLVLTGGADIDPSRYGAPPHEQTRDTRPDRDAWELALCTEALARDLPVLAVCRGLQVLNVALGGTLAQHLPEHAGNDAHRPRPGEFGSVRVHLAADSTTGGLLGDESVVSCHHHQAINRLAASLTAVGWAADGTIEAAELRSCRFALGVQWHPEEIEDDRRLFAALVTAARAGSHDAARVET